MSSDNGVLPHGQVCIGVMKPEEECRIERKLEANSDQLRRRGIGQDDIFLCNDDCRREDARHNHQNT